MSYFFASANSADRSQELPSRPPNVETAIPMPTDYPPGLLKFLAFRLLPKLPPNKKFRFIFVSRETGYRMWSTSSPERLLVSTLSR